MISSPDFNTNECLYTHIRNRLFYDNKVLFLLVFDLKYLFAHASFNNFYKTAFTGLA